MHRVIRPVVFIPCPLRQCRYNTTHTTKATSLATTEFNNLVIPSRQADRPDPGVSQRREARLARESLAASEFNGLAIPSRQELLSQNPSVTDRTDPGILQRRQARLSRESGRDERRQNMNQRSEGTGSQRKTPRRPAIPGRTPANHFEGLDALGQFTVRTKARDTSRGKKNKGPSRNNNSDPSRRVRPGTRMGSGSPVSMSRVSGALPQSEKSSRKQDEEELSFETIEKGGEESCGPALTDPKRPSFDLSNVIGRTQPQRQAHFGTKYIIECLGGDYTRYSAHTTQHIRGLDVVKQAQLALSKNRGIDLSQRAMLLRLVGTSAASNKQIVRA